MKKQNAKTSADRIKTFGKVLSYIKEFRLYLVFSILLSAVSVILSLYVPILVGNAIDYAVGSDNVDFEAIMGILKKIGGATLVIALCQWLMNVVNNHMTFGIVERIRRDAFLHLQKMPLSYADTHPTGEIVSRVIADTDQFADGVLLGFSQLFSGVVTIFGTLFFMLYIRWEIALVVLLVTPLSIAVASFISRRTYAMFKSNPKSRVSRPR
jgi:ATP-binding cassette subfamily B protein